jgi:hypothetical protein
VIPESNGDHEYSTQPKFSESKVNLTHLIASLTTTSEGLPEDDDSVARLRKLATSAIPRQNVLQPEDYPKSSPSQGQSSKVISAQDIFLDNVPDEVLVQPPTRQATLDSDFSLLSPQPPLSHLLNPDWTSTPLRLARIRHPPAVFDDDDEDTLTNDIFPHAIKILVKLTVNGKPGIQDVWEVGGLDWTTMNTFNELVPEDRVKKLQKAHKDLENQQMYCRYGSCKVESLKFPGYEEPGSLFRDYEQLGQHAIRNICYFISQHPFKGFRLSVRFDYGYAQIQKPVQERPDGDNRLVCYTKMIRREIEDKMQVNFMNQQYIPQSDLDVFLKPNIIREILLEDQTLSLDPDELERDAEEILRQCPKLFAICVAVGIRMRDLLHLRKKHEFGDNPDRRPRERPICKETGCEAINFKQIVGAEPQFFGEKVVFDYQYTKLSPWQVLPLQNTGNATSVVDLTGEAGLSGEAGPTTDDDSASGDDSTSEDDSGSAYGLPATAKREILGRGISGKVFAVKLDLGHNLPEVSLSILPRLSVLNFLLLGFRCRSHRL